MYFSRLVTHYRVNNVCRTTLSFRLARLASLTAMHVELPVGGMNTVNSIGSQSLINHLHLKKTWHVNASLVVQR